MDNGSFYLLQLLTRFAQFLTGVAGSLIETAFESWLNFEANFVFIDDTNGKREKNSFLREIFAKQVTIDCYSSIVLTGFASILYLNYGIIYPFYACIFFSLGAATIIFFLWKENDIPRLREMRKKEYENE